jgi:hypothetical protein
MVLTSGTTLTPSPMNIGATVTMTLSTRGVPSPLAGLRRKDDNTLDPPSTMTDFRPRTFKISGIEFGAIRPVHLMSFLSSRPGLELDKD